MFMQYPYGQPGNINFGPGLGGFQAAQMQPQQSMQRPIIFGRVVNQIEEITANDVPMDGTSGIFPMSDGSAIYKKRWNADGTIQTVKYVPEHIIEIEEKTPSEIDDLKDWLDVKFKELSTSSHKERRFDNDKHTANGSKHNKEQSTGSEQSKIERID